MDTMSMDTPCEIHPVEDRRHARPHAELSAFPALAANNLANYILFVLCTLLAQLLVFVVHSL